MKAYKLPKWRQEVEAILREQYKGTELEQWLKAADELIDLALEVEVPSRDSGKVVTTFLRLASVELRPLAAVYAGFQLGVAYERLRNANRT